MTATIDHPPTHATETLSASSEGDGPGARRHRGRTALRRTGGTLLGAFLVLLTVVGLSHRSTRADIEAHEDRVVAVSRQAGPVPVDEAAIAALPIPVRRWIDATFEDPTAISAAMMSTHVRFDFEGDFRRPLTEGFAPVRGSQVVATNEPALVFSATTTLFPGLFAVAYDAYADGEMEMKAKIESTITVVDERETPELNQTSLQRWLLMTPLYPTSLLPGGQVAWEAIDDSHARATVRSHGLSAALVFTFGEDGSIVSVDAESDGDLTTSYHGAGEHFAVSGYRTIDGIRVPHAFVVARASGGEILPFLEATVEGYES